MVCRKIIFEDVMAENFLVLMKDRRPLIQEAQGEQIKEKGKFIPRHTTMQNAKEKTVS